METINNVLFEVSEIELVYKSKISASLRPVIKSSQDVYDLFMQLWDQNTIELKEEFKVLFLNRANRLLWLYNVSSGGMTGTVADPRLIFIAALKVGACNMILCHNHPSGSVKPSKADEDLTYKIKQAGKFLDINVLDHLIIHPEGFWSFADEGLM